MARVTPTARCVSDLPLADLCIGCGACYAICPHGAIRLVRSDTYRPVVRRNLCVRCGLCVAVCPRVDAPGYVGGSPAESGECDGVGPARTCSVGHGTDEAVRFHGASGGVATAIVAYALRAGTVDGAVVTAIDNPQTVECRSFIATSPEQLRDTQGSFYCPTAPLTALRRGGFEGFSSLAFVGLPCHVLALRKMQSVCPALKERVVLVIGLFCGRGVTDQGARAALHIAGGRRAAIAEIGFRDKGWPGGLRVAYRDGAVRTVPHEDYWPSLFAPYFFTPYGCLTCTDLTAESADVSLGDAWLPEVRARDSVGTSLVVTRSEPGEDAIHRMLADGAVDLGEVGRGKVVEAQRGVMRRKKVAVRARAGLMHRLGMAIPARMGTEAFRRRHWVGAAAVLFSVWFSGTALGAWLIPRLPKGLLRRYGRFIQRFSH